MKKISLEEFMKMQERNAWLFECGISLYCRKQKILLDDKLIPVLCIANFTNPKRAKNIEFQENPKSTGKLRELLSVSEAMCKKYHLSGIMIEQVINKWLPYKLVEYGYSVYPNYGITLSHVCSFYKLIPVD
jgi:hypothetical protein